MTNEEHSRQSDVSLSSVNEVLKSIREDIKELKENQKDNMKEIKTIHTAMWNKIDIQNDKIQKLETKTSNIELKLVGVGMGVAIAWDWVKSKL